MMSLSFGPGQTIKNQMMSKSFGPAQKKRLVPMLEQAHGLESNNQTLKDISLHLTSEKDKLTETARRSQ